MNTMIHIIHQIAYYRILGIALALFVFLLVITKRKLFVLGLSILALAVLNFMYGYRLSHYLIHTYGQNGIARITGAEKVNVFYNSKEITEYRAVIHTINNDTVHAIFRNNVPHVYPIPKTDYIYPRQGVPFPVKYIKNRPDLFVIVLQ